MMSKNKCRRATTTSPATVAAAFEADEPFERIPDSVLLFILNKVADIKALGKCCAVSKRFRAVAPMVGNVVVKVDCVISGEDNALNVKARGFFGSLARFVFGSIVKPLQALQHMLGPKRSIVAAEVSHHSPGEVLRNFKEVQHLRIELPGGELEVEDGFLLKWKAEFGSTLESCVILGASSLVKREGAGRGRRLQRSWLIHRRGSTEADRESDDDNGSIPESLSTDIGLKLRVVWTISSLIAASGRHYLLQNIIAEHPTMESLILTDGDGQGVLCMNKAQLQEFRDKPLAASSSSNRTQVPALNIRLWYAPHLTLPGGIALKGATLVAIRPSDHPHSRESDGLEFGAFEEPFQTAANELVKRRTYWLEMNSF